MHEVTLQTLLRQQKPASTRTQGKLLEQGELAVRYQALYDLTDTMFHKNQQIMSDLNEISYTLAKNDDAMINKVIDEKREIFNGS